MWKVIVGIFLTFLAIIELLQIAVSVKRYFASSTNYIQVAILVGGAILIFDRYSPQIILVQDKMITLPLMFNSLKYDLDKNTTMISKDIKKKPRVHMIKNT